jgi:hypothetical protein
MKHFLKFLTPYSTKLKLTLNPDGAQGLYHRIITEKPLECFSRSFYEESLTYMIWWRRNK